MAKFKFSSFAALNVTQFCSALNDNIYKLLTVFLFINIEGIEATNKILAIAGAVVVAPFLILANIAGTLADRFSKRSIICITRVIEIGVVLAGVLSIYFRSIWGGYAILFLMSVQSAIFSPAKYGIIPEIVKNNYISRCNGIMTGTTYLAIILGTFLASFLSDVTHRNFFLASFACVVVALVGLTSFAIEKTAPQATKKKMTARLFVDIYRALKHARKIRYLFATILFGAYFTFIGAYTQLNIIPFAFQSLHLREIQGGYLFLMTAVGIGLGAFLAGRLSGKEVELGYVPLAALGITVALTCLYFFEAHFYVVVPILMFLGMLGGFYIVPIDAFIQVASPPEERGRNVAATNFLSFTCVILASGLIALLGSVLKFTAAQGFLVVGLITLLLTCSLFYLLSDQVLRLIVAKAAQRFWSLKIVGIHNIRLKPPVLLIGQRLSWLDTIIVMATLPRLIHYIVPIEGRFLKGRSYLYRLLRLFPIDMHHFKIGGAALKEIRRELNLGHSVCLMHPVSSGSKTLKEWEATLSSLLHEIDVPVVPIHISRTVAEKRLNLFGQIKLLFKRPIKVSYGERIEKLT